MNLYQMYETDPDLERKGIRLDIAPNVHIMIARAGGGNSQFAKVSSQVMKPFRAAIDVIPDSKVAELQATIYARAVIQDWQGITDRDGNILEFTEANVVQILTDLPDLFAMIRVIASDSNGFRVKQSEDAAGNSQTG